MKEINLKDSVYKIFYPEQDMDESSKELIKTFAKKIFGEESKIYFTDDSNVEVFIKTKTQNGLLVNENKTANETVKKPDDPNAPVELDPLVLERMKDPQRCAQNMIHEIKQNEQQPDEQQPVQQPKKKLSGKCSGYPPMALNPDGSFA